MINTVFAAILGFISNVLSLIAACLVAVATPVVSTMSAVAGALFKITLVVLPVVFNVTFGIFYLTTILAGVWFSLLILTIFLAPVGEISRRTRVVTDKDGNILDVAYDPDLNKAIDLYPPLLLKLPINYLPELLREFALARAKEVQYLTVNVAKDLCDISISLGKWFAHKTKLDLLFPAKKTGEVAQ